MIWTRPSELPLIQLVAEAIVADVSGPRGLQLGSHYCALAPSLFSGIGLSVTAHMAKVTDLTVIVGTAGTSGVSLTIGVIRVTAANTTDTARTLGGALCQELVHRKQRARDPISFDMAAAAQKAWHASRSQQPSPEEWLAGYFATVHEFEGHAEQIAYELWLTDTLAGVAPRKSVNIGTITNSEPLRRIGMRLTPAGTASQVVATWFTLFEQKINEALASW